MDEQAGVVQWNAYAKNQEIIGSLRAAPMVGLVTLKVNPEFQNKGIGTELMKLYIDYCKLNKCTRVVFSTSPENLAMLKIAQKLNFTLTQDDENEIYGSRIATLLLS